MEQAIIPVLDYGYVRPIEGWGSDARIIEAARMSTGKGFLGWGGKFPCTRCLNAGLLTPDGGKYATPAYAQSGKKCPECQGTGRTIGDEKLLAFLYNNKHATPFEMAGMVIEIKAPIFVFREWHRHRTQSYNEMSARYIPLPDENYRPTVDRLMLAGGSNKQAQGAAGTAGLTGDAAQDWLARLDALYTCAQAVYEDGLKLGVPKELARLPVPVARYSRMRASANLRNWLAFLTLRAAPAAQWEIRQFAIAVGRVIAERFPRTWELFDAERSRG